MLFQENEEFDDKNDYEIDPDVIDVQETAYKKLKSSSSTAVLPVVTEDSTDNALEAFKPEVINSTLKNEHQAWFYDTPGVINENQVNHRDPTKYGEYIEILAFVKNCNNIQKTNYTLQKKKYFYHPKVGLDREKLCTWP